MSLSHTLHDEEMVKVVELFLQQLLKKHPELAPAINQNKKELVDKMINILSLQNNLDKRSLSDPAFLKQLTITFVTAISINKMDMSPGANPLKKLDELLKAKGIDLKDPKFNPKDPRFDPKLLLKKLQALTAEDKIDIHLEMKRFCTQVIKDLEKTGFLIPKPKPDGKRPDLEEEMTKNLSRYSNLLGINSTGLLVLVQCALGNGLGFPDMNPNHGFAQIDRTNDPNDSAYSGGDYHGSNASTMSHLLTFAGDAFVAQFKAELQRESLAISSTPTLTRK